MTEKTTKKRKRSTKPKATTETQVTTSAVTSEEAAIISRSESETVDWFGLTEGDLHDFSLMEDPLKLPKPCQKLQEEKVFAFRWCERTSKRVDQLTRSVGAPLRWAIVNMTTAKTVGLPIETLKEIEEHFDTILGCVPCLDQLLLFKPWSHHILVQNAKRDLAENLDSSGKLKSHEAKSDESYQFMAGPEHKIGSGDDVQKIEGVTDDDGGIIGDGTTDNADLGALVVAE